MKLRLFKNSHHGVTVDVLNEDGTPQPNAFTKMVLVLGGAVKIDLSVAVEDMRVGQEVTLTV